MREVAVRKEEGILATITFLFDGDSKTVRLPETARHGAGGARPTLLDVARDNGVPLLANCGTGDCGACRVEVTSHAGSALPKSEAEAFFLRAVGRLDAPADPGAHARLACQYRLSDDEEIEVRFTTMLGCL